MLSIAATTVISTRTATTSTTSTSFTTTTRLITSTVARNPGFTAILNDPLYEAKKRDVKRATELQMLAAKSKSSPLYPQRVRCGKEVPSYSTKVVTTIVNGKRVTLKAATRTKMSTITTTILTTEF